MNYTLLDSTKRLFVSRHFLVFIASIIGLFFNKLTGDQFSLLMLYVLGTSTIEKYKDVIKIGGNK